MGFSKSGGLDTEGGHTRDIVASRGNLHQGDLLRRDARKGNGSLCGLSFSPDSFLPDALQLLGDADVGAADFSPVDTRGSIYGRWDGCIDYYLRRDDLADSGFS